MTTGDGVGTGRSERNRTMPQEVVDLLIQGQRELKEEIEKLRETMQREHKELSDRVLSLEHNEKITRWIFAAGGTVAGFLIREVVQRIVSG